MRVSRRLFVLFGLSLVLHGFAVADDAVSREFMEKAIENNGGEKVLAKYKGTTSKMKGTIQLNGAPVIFTGELSSQVADQMLISISLVLDGQSISFVSALNHDQGWLKINSDTIDMSAEQFKETKETTYSGWGHLTAAVERQGVSVGSVWRNRNRRPQSDRCERDTRRTPPSQSLLR